jgi:peptidoglycan biosynthesis protein MviN/MurJ (putative lipid II flippase)
MAVNAVLCYLIVNNLVWPDLPNHIGIAVALSISGWMNTIILALWSFAKGYFRVNKEFIHSLVRIAVITALLGVICYGIKPWIVMLGFDDNVVYRWVGLGIIVVVASITFVITNIYYKKVIGIKA